MGQNPSTDFVVAAGKGQLDVMKKMVSEGAVMVDSQDDGRTALMAAASQDKQDVVRWLLTMKAKLEIADKDGWTALMIASFCGNLPVVKILITAGARADAQNPQNGWTALMKAASYGELEVCKFLVDAHANVNVQGRDGKTALMLSAWKGNNEIADLLIKKGAKVELLTEQGWTALMVAAFCGKADLVAMLIDHKAQIDVRNVDGRTALMEAASRGNLDVVEFLVKKGADTTIESEDGLTALTEAAVAGKLDVVEYLVSTGCDMTNSNGLVFDIQDKEALSAAIKRGLALRNSKSKTSSAGDDDSDSTPDTSNVVTGGARPEEISIAIVGSTHVQIGERHFEFKSGDPLTKVFGKDAQLLDIKGKVIKTKKDQGLHIPQALQPGRILVIGGKRFALQVVLGVKPAASEGSGHAKFADEEKNERVEKHASSKPQPAGVAELVSMRVPSRFSTGSVAGSVDHRDSKHVEWSEFNFAYSPERWSISVSMTPEASMFLLPQTATDVKSAAARTRRNTGFRKGAPSESVDNSADKAAEEDEDDSADAD